MTRSERSDHGSRGMVVGVDGSAASVHAIRYARAEAARHGDQVEVIHVVPDHAPIAGPHPVPPDELMAAGRAALRSSLDLLGPSTPGVLMRAHLQRGSVVSSLVAASHNARGIVVGSDRRPVPMRLLTGNVSTGLAARSPVAVISVPETWTADRSTGVVLVGVKHTDRAGALLAAACAVAQDRHCRLRILHAWRLPSCYDDIIADRVALEDWRELAHRELERQVSPLRPLHAGVEIEIVTVHDQAAHALVEASAGADEVVIMRRSHGVPPAAHLGSTARTVLLHARCPVRVVPSLDPPLMTHVELEALEELGSPVV